MWYSEYQILKKKVLSFYDMVKRYCGMNQILKKSSSCMWYSEIDDLLNSRDLKKSSSCCGTVKIGFNKKNVLSFYDMVQTHCGMHSNLRKSSFYVTMKRHCGMHDDLLTGYDLKIIIQVRQQKSRFEKVIQFYTKVNSKSFYLKCGLLDDLLYDRDF